MKIVEMRVLETAALEAEIEKSRKELLELRCKVAQGEDVHPHRVKQLRREIARILTVINEKTSGSKA
ncbi:MAG: 50S ribosomal protein L29 [Planctomycetota bacterium]|jgi:large subunit ribosomal protein L29|nr:50S ribosomal protein L29 [Planctomycetota bacterium]